MNNESTKTSTTSIKTNRTNESDTTIGSNTKRKRKELFKVKNNRDKKQVRVRFRVNRTPSKEAGNDIKIKHELIETAVKHSKMKTQEKIK